MRLGIFGGSFHPPHRGHLIAAEAFCEALSLDQLLIIPAGTPPHKKLELGCSEQQRLKMARLNFASLSTPHRVSDMEMKREGKSYTLHTLQELRAQMPEAELFLYTGSDMLTSFHLWYGYQKILSLCTLCVMKREETPEGFAEALTNLNACSPTPIRLIDAPHIVESSTHLRDCLKKGEPTPGLLPEVEGYIRQEGLYR